jgi:ribonuclease HI
MQKKSLLRQLASIEKVLDQEHLHSAFNKIKDAILDLPDVIPQTEDKVFSIPMELLGKEHTYILYSDGACRGNPGPGAFGCLVQDSNGALLFEHAETMALTTNNQMEMMGVLVGMRQLVQHLQQTNAHHDINLRVITDSRYVVDGMTKWLEGWKSRGWKKADNKVPENLDLWQQLDMMQIKFKKLEFEWVKGHAGHPQNEHCDRLANLALDHEGY